MLDIVARFQDQFPFHSLPFSQLRKRDSFTRNWDVQGKEEKSGQHMATELKGPSFSWILMIWDKLFFICQMGIRKYPLA